MSSNKIGKVLELDKSQLWMLILMLVLIIVFSFFLSESDLQFHVILPSFILLVAIFWIRNTQDWKIDYILNKNKLISHLGQNKNNLIQNKREKNSKSPSEIDKYLQSKNNPFKTEFIISEKPIYDQFKFSDSQHVKKNAQNNFWFLTAQENKSATDNLVKLTGEEDKSNLKKSEKKEHNSGVSNDHFKSGNQNYQSRLHSDEKEKIKSNFSKLQTKEKMFGFASKMQNNSLRDKICFQNNRQCLFPQNKGLSAIREKNKDKNVSSARNLIHNESVENLKNKNSNWVSNSTVAIKKEIESLDLNKIAKAEDNRKIETKEHFPNREKKDLMSVQKSLFNIQLPVNQTNKVLKNEDIISTPNQKSALFVKETQNSSIPEFKLPESLPVINSIQKALKENNINELSAFKKLHKGSVIAEPFVEEVIQQEEATPTNIRKQSYSMKMLYLEEMTSVFTKLVQKCKTIPERNVQSFEADRKQMNDFFGKFSCEIDDHFVFCCENLVSVFRKNASNHEKFIYLVTELAKEIFLDIRKNSKSNKIKIVY